LPEEVVVMNQSMRRVSFGRGIALCAMVALVAAGAFAALAEEQAPGGTKRVVDVSIDNFTFTPAEITIAPGTTVRWVNHDDIPHTVVEASRTFKSRTLDTEDSFSMTFSVPGSFGYFCSLHPHMTGKVIVRSGS
jgi:plastocyanin